MDSQGRILTITSSGQDIPFLWTMGIWCKSSFFEVPAQTGGQKLILFDRFEAKVKVLEKSETDKEPLEFYQLDSAVVRMMKSLSYNFENKRLRLRHGSPNSTSVCCLEG